MAFVLGWLGLHDVASRTPAPTEFGHGPLDVVYYTLQLFLLASEPLNHPVTVPVTLQIARFLAPATTVLTLGITAKAVLDSTYYSARGRRLRGHTVICGSGTPVTLLAQSVSAEGRPCVVLDGSGRDPTPRRDEGHTRARGTGTILRIDDTVDAELLRAARVDRAREVVVATGDSARNADIMVALRACVDGAERPPRCFLEMASPELAAALAAHDLTSASPWRMEFFEPVDQAVRRLVASHLPYRPDGVSAVAIGDGTRHRTLLAHLRRRARALGLAIEVHDVAPDGVSDLDPASDVAVAFVCTDDDVATVRLGLRTFARLRDRPIEIVVMTASSTALGAAISGSDVTAERRGRARLTIFNSYEHVHTIAALRDGFYLDIARVAHEEYLRHARARGDTGTSVVPWDRLAADKRNANLAQALDIGRKLRSIHCVAVPAYDEVDVEAGFAYQGDEVEDLAKLEHQRWRQEREAAGWRYGARDDEALVHDDLVDWEALSEESRQKDRDAVLAVPRQLSAVGLRILRPRP